MLQKVDNEAGERSFSIEKRIKGWRERKRNEPKFEDVLCTGTNAPHKEGEHAEQQTWTKKKTLHMGAHQHQASHCEESHKRNM